MTEAKAYPAPVSPPVAMYACGLCIANTVEKDLRWAQVSADPDEWDWICYDCVTCEPMEGDPPLLSSDLTAADYHQQQRSV